MTNLDEIHRRGEYGPCGNPQCDLTGHEWGPYTQWHRVWLCASCLLTAQRAEKEILVNRELTEQMSRHLDEQGYPPLQDGRLTGHVDWATLAAMDEKADWLLEPVIPRGRMVAMFAPAGEGKSELALYLALCAATGRDLHGHTGHPPIVTTYFDFEQSPGILRDRVTDLGYNLDTDDLSHLHYYLYPDLDPLDTQTGGDMIREEITDLDAGLVFIDTTMRVLSGSENDSDTLRDFNRHTGGPLIADGRTVFRLDHAGKNLKLGQRGTSAKNDTTDMVWEQKRRQDATRLIGWKRRDPWVPLEVDLDRVESLDRVEYRLATTRTWGPRTGEIAEHLDRLGLPVDTGRRIARRALADIGVQVRNETLAEAIRYRQQPQPLPPIDGDTPGDTPTPDPGHTTGTKTGNPYDTSPGHVRGHTGTTPRGDSGPESVTLGTLGATPENDQPPLPGNII